MATWNPIGSLKGPKGDAAAPSFTNITTSSYVLQPGDANGVVYSNTYTTLVIPADATVNFPLGTRILLICNQYTLTLTCESGASFASDDGQRVMQSGDVYELIKQGANWWRVRPFRPLGSPLTTVAISSGVATLDLSRGDFFQLTMTGDATLDVLSASQPRAFNWRAIAIIVTQDTTGGRPLTMPNLFVPLGSSPTKIESAPKAVTLITAMPYVYGTPPKWTYAMAKVNA